MNQFNSSLTQNQKEEIIAKVRNHPSKKVKLAVSDIDGILRGKVIAADKFLSSVDGGLGFCDVVFGWDMNDKCYDNTSFTGWHSGYPDAQVKLDLQTFRQIPWDHQIPFFLGEFLDAEGKAHKICPRQILKNVRRECINNGFTPFFSQEFEWFNFRETSQDLHQREFTGLKPITPGMFGYSLLRSSLNGEFFNELFDLLGQFDIPLEGLHTETGPGVYEGAIQYGDILLSADRAILFKTAVKEVALRHGILASFMAKWNYELPGCSGHIHQSLWNKSADQNLFFDSTSKNNMSKIFQHYVAGVLHCLPHILPMLAPTINSYKRLVEGAWAPTTLTWGIDNRTTAIRLLGGSEKSTRLEFRVPGSDVNPYLAMAASLASGLYGIKNELPLIGNPVTGNGYAVKDYGILPNNLFEATKIMKSSSIANELFGEVFVQHFCQTRDWEWRQFQSAVTDWELKRYFEII